MIPRRKTWVFIFIVLVVIQFIQPKRNVSHGISEHDITRAYTVPEHIRQTFTQKCYDCHSNHTRYPWYFHLQPIGWWLAAHIYDAKGELNFSEFATYDTEKGLDKLEEIVEVIREGTMPIRGYRLLHPESAVTEEEQRAIEAWVASIRRSAINAAP